MHATQCPWFMRAVTGSSSDHFFRMAHLRGTENYTSRRKEGERESCVTDMQFFLWMSRMPLTSPPGDIAKAMFAFHKMKPFQRLFHTEYSESSELIFYGSSGNLHGMVNSTAGVRQSSSLSTLYFCTFFQPLLETMAHEFPELYIYAYIDDVNFASKDPALISTAFQRFKVLLQEKRIELSCQKCVWFTGKNDIAIPGSLEC